MPLCIMFNSQARRVQTKQVHANTPPLNFTSEALATQTATCVINMLMEGASRAAPMSVSPTYVTRPSSAVLPACSDTTAHSC
jgi:hypothetical protein